MQRGPRTILLAGGGFVGIVVVAATALLLLVNAGVQKSRLEATASQGLGLAVSVDGQVKFAFIPGLVITLRDVHIRNAGVDVAFAPEAALEIDVFPLLKKEVRIRKIVLKHPRISIERARDGRFNFEKSEPTSVSSAALPITDWPGVSLSDGTIVYTDKASGGAFDARNCNLDARRLDSSGERRTMKDLSFAADLNCEEVHLDGFAVSDLKLSAKAKNGFLNLDPVTMRVYGAQGAGSFQADLSGAVPIFSVRYSLRQFPLEESFKAISTQKVATGRMDFSADLSMQGSTVKEIRQTMKGRITLQGRNLTLAGTDLDLEFAKLESSQNYNLVDVGAFFFAGPLGLLVTRGYDLANLLKGAEGTTEIRTLIAEWNVEHGLAQAHDVALATRENRIALQGGLDFVNDQFSAVTIALIDASGCVKVRQKIAGTFENPRVEGPSFIRRLSAPALSLLKKGKKLLSGGECEVFYAGSVPAPA